MFTQTNHLTGQQLYQVGQLLEICQTADGHFIPIYPHILQQPRNGPYSILYEDAQGHLLGFLSVFFFYDEAVEAAVMVHPQHRQKGLATRMLHQIVPLITSKNVSRIIFSAVPAQDGACLTRRHGTYLNSEYLMKRTTLQAAPTDERLIITKAAAQDIPFLCAVDSACFSNPPENKHNRFRQVLHDESYCIFIASFNGTPVGKAHIRWQQDGAYLSDIAIIPAQQKQGFGRALLAHCIQTALSQNKPNLSLEVETHRKNALKLYQSFDFKIINVCDFWSTSLDDLKVRHKEHS